MEIKDIVCPVCDGRGVIATWHEVQTKRDVDGMLIAGTEICPECKGKGTVPRPDFTVEEAMAILEHCGLTETKRKQERQKEKMIKTINFHVPDGATIPTTLALLINGITLVIYRQIPNQLTYEFTVYDDHLPTCDMIVHELAECMSKQSINGGYYWAIQKVDYAWGTTGLFHVYRVYFTLEEE